MPVTARAGPSPAAQEEALRHLRAIAVRVLERRSEENACAPEQAVAGRPGGKGALADKARDTMR